MKRQVEALSTTAAPSPDTETRMSKAEPRRSMPAAVAIAGTSKKSPSVKAKSPSFWQKKPRRRKRPSNAQLRALNARLKAATSLDERRGIYKESGYHPSALSQWFRLMGLERFPIALDPPHRRTRPADERLRELHARLQGSTTTEQRKAIYEECGHHHAALTRWFLGLGLEKLRLLPPPKEGVPKNTPRHSRIEDVTATTATVPAVAASSKKLTLVPGLSLQARETAIALLAALLAE